MQGGAWHHLCRQENSFKNLSICVDPSHLPCYRGSHEAAHTATAQRDPTSLPVDWGGGKGLTPSTDSCTMVDMGNFKYMFIVQGISSIARKTGEMPDFFCLIMLVEGVALFLIGATYVVDAIMRGSRSKNNVDTDMIP